MKVKRLELVSELQRMEDCYACRVYAAYRNGHEQDPAVIAVLQALATRRMADALDGGVKRYKGSSAELPW